MDASNLTIPPYHRLPAAEGTGMRHAWDFFGRDDVRGTLNFLTAERRRDALGSVRTGETVNLTLPLDQPDIPPFSRSSLQHEVYAANEFSWGDRVSGMDPQSSSQWDGLLHVSHSTHGFYGGRRGGAAALSEIGIDAWAQSGIVGRGVLVDVPRHLGQSDPLSGRALSAEELSQMLAAQGSALRPGDVLCLRFGWADGYRALDPETREQYMRRPSCDGMSATESTAAMLWDHQIAAVVSDNPTVEAQPGDRELGFLHHRLLTMLGMPFGELFDLDALSSHCSLTGEWDFLFVSVPWNLPGGVSSPANAVAVV